MRAGIWSEVLAPAAGLVVVVAASLLRSPILMGGLTFAWFGPMLARRFAGIAPLDERERAICRVAEQWSLTALLAMVSLLPTLLAQTGGALETLRTEWADLGFLLLAVFFVRLAIVAHRGVARPAAAHLAGGMATAVTVIGAFGLAWSRPGSVPGWVLAATAICLVPHLVAPMQPTLGGVLWLGGAALTALYVMTAGFIPLERVVLLSLLTLPWALAAYWMLAPGDR